MRNTVIVKMCKTCSRLERKIFIFELNPLKPSVQAGTEIALGGLCNGAEKLNNVIFTGKSKFLSFTSLQILIKVILT